MISKIIFASSGFYSFTDIIIEEVGQYSLADVHLGAIKVRDYKILGIILMRSLCKGQTEADTILRREAAHGDVKGRPGEEGLSATGNTLNAGGATAKIAPLLDQIAI